MERILMHPAHCAERVPSLSASHWLNTEDPIDLQSLRGRVVVLCAFEMYCASSVSHGLPQAARVRETFDSSDVAVIGLHSAFEPHERMGPLTLAAFLLEYDVHIPVAVDSDKSTGTMDAYGIESTPSLVLIDRLGRLRAHVFGRPSDMLLGGAVATLLSDRENRPVVHGRKRRILTPMDTAFTNSYRARPSH